MQEGLRVSIVRNFRLQAGTEDFTPWEFAIVIPPTENGGLGIDTTKLYALLPTREQSAHNARAKTVVTAVAHLSKRMLTTEITNNIIRIRVARGPLRVRRRQVPEIANLLDDLLKMVSTQADLELDFF
jgi:hypothetical protein